MRAVHALMPVAALLMTVPSTTEPPERGWRLAEVRGIEVDGEIASLSPDGAWLAGIGPSGNTFCVWDTETLTPECDDTDIRISRQTPVPTMAWAPDSSAVAFDLDALVAGSDSDIYVFDVDAAELANVTDDGYDGSLFDAPADVPVDIVPTWSPDGAQVAFVRNEGGDDQRTTIVRIDRHGGDPEVVHRLDVAEPFAVWTPMYWRPDDTIAYTQATTDVDDPTNGIWSVPVDGGKPRRLVPGSAGAEIPGVALAGVRGDVASVFSPRLVAAFGDPSVTKFWISDLAAGSIVPVPNLDPDTGAAVPPEASGETVDADTLAWPVTPAGLSPSGETGLVTYRTGEQLAFATVDTTTGDVVLLGLRIPFVPTLPEPPQWAADDVVLLRGPFGNALLADLDPTSPSPARR